MSDFKNFVEEFNDIFGFEELRNKKADVAPPDEQPIQPFAISGLLDHLLRKRLGETEATQRFTDEVRWGNSTGSMRIKITPMRSIIISRLSNNLQGENIWICKKFYSIDSSNFTGHEDTVANDIFKQVEKIAYEPVDAAVRDFSNLYALVQHIAKDTRSKIPGMFTYDDIKRISESDYIINFSIRAMGVGKLSRRGTAGRRATLMPFMQVEVVYMNATGVIHVVLSTVSISPEGNGWSQDIPFFDEKFMPSQSKEEIEKVIVAAITYF